MRNNHINGIMEKIGLAVALSGFSLTLNSPDRYLMLVFCVFIALTGILPLVRKISTNQRWLSFVNSLDQIDVSGVGFGIGIMLATPQFEKYPYVFALVLVGGGMVAAFGAGKMIREGMRDMIASDARILSVLGVLVSVFGIIMLCSSINQINWCRPITWTQPVLLIAIGIMFVVFGYQSLKYHRATRRVA